MTRTLLVQAALGGPAVAGLAWFGLSFLRWRWPRRTAGILLALAAHTAAWVVFWLAFRGQSASWRAFDPSLLGATVAVASEAAILLAALRIDGLSRREAPVGGLALGVATSAVVAAAYTTSLPVQAMVLAIPTVAAAAASLSTRGRPELRGLLVLAASDVVAAVGFTVAQVRSDGTALEPSHGAAAFLLLAAAAVKAGAVPGLGTWRLAAQRGPGGVAAVAVRAHGMALAVIGGVLLGGASPSVPVAAVAAGALVVAGAVAVAGRDEAASLSAVVGAGAALPFLALGLGGAVGTRAFLVLFPVFLLAAGSIALVGRPGRGPPGPARAGWRWLGAAALGAAALSILGFPPGGGFPGSWLTLSLAGLRAEASPWWLLVIGGALVGLALAGLAAVPAVRSVRPGPLRAIPAGLAAAALLYVGLQPVRLAVGWWVRVEEELGTPMVLAATGAPDLPALGGLNLALVLAEVAAIVGLVILLGRGFRDAAAPFVPAASGRLADGVRRGLGRGPMARPAALLAGARRRGLDLGLLLALELTTGVLAARAVIVAADSGFL
ncbi:MAG: hypothetical protein ACRDKA_14100 [Actinomycetota bacterium]